MQPRILVSLLERERDDDLLALSQDTKCKIVDLMASSDVPLAKDYRAALKKLSSMKVGEGSLPPLALSSVMSGRSAALRLVKAANLFQEG